MLWQDLAVYAMWSQEILLYYQGAAIWFSKHIVIAASAFCILRSIFDFQESK